jgi:hypothetical protein
MSWFGVGWGVIEIWIGMGTMRGAADERDVGGGLMVDESFGTGEGFDSFFAAGSEIGCCYTVAVAVAVAVAVDAVFVFVGAVDAVFVFVGAVGAEIVAVAIMTVAHSELNQHAGAEKIIPLEFATVEVCHYYSAVIWNTVTGLEMEIW